jgi:hypothetical protein
MMDDMWLFDNEEKTLIDDFLLIESLLNDRDLSVNEEKSIILKGHDPAAAVPPDLDAMKIGLLQRRREALVELGDYAEDDESEGDELAEQRRTTVLAFASKAGRRTRRRRRASAHAYERQFCRRNRIHSDTNQ